MAREVQPAPPAGLLDVVVCPRCRGPLSVRVVAIACPGCGESYPRFGRVPVLLAEPHAYIEICRRQLATLREHIETTARRVEEQLATSDVVPATRDRCRALVSASRRQYGDLATVLSPSIGDAAPPQSTEASDPLPSILTNLHYLFRDWGPSNPIADPDENTQSRTSVARVLADHRLGRTLVIGAGACRLAYDLCIHGDADEMVAIDIDPLLVAVADIVVRGGVVRMTESSVDVNETAGAERSVDLRAPHGPLDERFHLMLADGLAPPLRPGSFDTVLTPWFIDAIPADLREAISVAHQQLRPGGRWINLGPLRYNAHVPISRRFTREEVFDLADRAGFGIVSWHAGSEPAVVSALTGRGRIEWILAFAADKRSDAPPVERDHPPAWLVFAHLPIPVSTDGLSVGADDPLPRLIASLIDGERSLDDVTAVVSSQLGRTGLSRQQVREAVRRSLADIHPACRTS